MSHTTTAKVQLKQVNKKLLVAAAKTIGTSMKAKIKEGMKVEVGGNWKNWGGTKTKCDVAIRWPGFDRGLGVNVTKEGIEFKYDDYGCRNEVDEAKKLVVRNYKVMATLAALRAAGMSVKTKETQKGVEIVAMR